MKVSRSISRRWMLSAGCGNANADVDESVTTLTSACQPAGYRSGNANADVDESVTIMMNRAILTEDNPSGNANADVDESVTSSQFPPYTGKT